MDKNKSLLEFKNKLESEGYKVRINMLFNYLQFAVDKRNKQVAEVVVQFVGANANLNVDEFTYSLIRKKIRSDLRKNKVGQSA